MNDFTQLHPFHRRGADPETREQWIARFRSVFLSDTGLQCLSFLADMWHFQSRELPTPEWVVQRQCFMDLLICCGLVDTSILQPTLRALAQQEEGNKFWGWLLKWRALRVPRAPQSEDKKK